METVAFYGGVMASQVGGLRWVVFSITTAF